jgi:hypothetical protein
MTSREIVFFFHSLMSRMNVGTQITWKCQFLAFMIYLQTTVVVHCGISGTNLDNFRDSISFKHEKRFRVTSYTDLFVLRRHFTGKGIIITQKCPEWMQDHSNREMVYCFASVAYILTSFCYLSYFCFLLLFLIF